MIFYFFTIIKCFFETFNSILIYDINEDSRFSRSVRFVVKKQKINIWKKSRFGLQGKWKTEKKIPFQFSDWPRVCKFLNLLISIFLKAFINLHNLQDYWCTSASEWNLWFSRMSESNIGKTVSHIFRHFLLCICGFE